MQNSITVPTLEQIKQAIWETMLEFEKTKIKTSNKVYSKNQARITLGIGYEKLNKLIDAGLLKTTADGKLTEFEINKYLGNE